MSIAEINPVKSPEKPTPELASQLTAMKEAQRRYGTPDRHLRLDRLGRIAKMVKANREAIISAIDADFAGRAREETLLAEIFTSLSTVRHARKNLAIWMRPRRRALDLAFRPARAKLLPQPLGVVGVISPWNYPLYLALSPLIGALAAGNRVMVKPSEITPNTSALLAKMIDDHFAPDEIAVVEGGREIGEAFSRLPFDHLLYTGSTNVGRKIMAAAAQNLTPVTLELGGKSPAIIAPDGDLKAAAVSIARGKLFNAGQTCVAPDYVLVSRETLDSFVEQILGVSATFYPSLEDNGDYSSVVNSSQFERLNGMLREAQDRGAKVRAAGEASGHKLPLTILLDTKPDMAVRREEIFGPLLPVIAYDDLADAIDMVQQGDRPLALYIYARDKSFVDRVLNETISGGAVVNDCFIHAGAEDLPFGGVGASGMGHYHGREGFETFSKLKPVLYQSRWNGMWLLNPPYGRRAKAMIDLLLKR